MGKCSKANQMQKSTNHQDTNNGRIDSFPKPNRKFQLALQGLDKQSVKSKINDPKVLQANIKSTSKQNLSFTNGKSDTKSNSKLNFSTTESKDKISFIRSGSNLSSERTPEPISFNNLFNSQISSLKENQKERSNLDKPSSLSFVRSQKDLQYQSCHKNQLEKTKDNSLHISKPSQDSLFSSEAHPSHHSRKNVTNKTESSHLGEYEISNKLSSVDISSKNSSVSYLNNLEAKQSSPRSQKKSHLDDNCQKNSYPLASKDKNSKIDNSQLSPKDASTSQDNINTSRESNTSANILSRLGSSKRKKSVSPTREYKDTRRSENGSHDQNSKSIRVNSLSSRLGPLPRVFSEDRSSNVDIRSVHSRIGSNKAQLNEDSTSKNLKPGLPPLRFNMPSGRNNLTMNMTSSTIAGDSSQKSFQNLESRSFPQTSANTPRFVNKFELVRCAFFPNCTRSGCLYFHPQEDCPNGELCSDLDSGCLFVHPSDKKPKMCRFDATCNRSDCPYEHLNRKLTVENPDSFIPIICNKSGCSELSCLFVHPNQQLPFSKAPCIFGARCNRFPCDRFHSSLFRSRAPPKNNPLLPDIKKSYLSVFGHLVYENNMT